MARRYAEVLVCCSPTLNLMGKLLACRHVFAQVDQAEQLFSQVVMKVLQKHVAIEFEVIVLSWRRAYVVFDVGVGQLVPPSYLSVGWEEQLEGSAKLIVQQVVFEFLVDLFGVVLYPIQFGQ